MTEETAGGEKQRLGAAPSGIARRARAVRDVVRSITERKRPRETLRLSEERFRSTLDGLLEGCQIIGFDWRYLYVNDAVARHGRRNKEELLGRTMMEIYPGVEDTEMFAYLQRCMEERVPHRMENEFTYPDGDKAWFELSIEPVPEGTLVLSWDVTERKRVEEELRRREEEIRVIAENVPALFSYIDVEGHYRFVNKRYEEWFGISPIQATGKHFKEVLGEDAYELIRDRVEKALSGEHVRFEDFVPYKHGGARWVIADYVPDADDQGKVRGFFALVTDITERKWAEEALRESNERFRRLAEAASEGILISREERIVEANQCIADMFGYEPSELIGMTPFDLFTAQSAEVITANIRSGHERPYEVVGVRKGGNSFPAEVVGKDCRYDGRPARVASVRDITERKRAEEALRKSKEIFEKTFLSQRDAIFLLDAQSPPTITDCNPRATEIFGYSREEMLGRTTAFLHVSEAELREFQQQVYPAVTGQGFLHLPDFHMKRKDGIVFPTTHSVMPLEDEKGSRIGWVSVVHDITERKRAGEALRESEEQYRELVEDINDIVFAVDENGEITYISPIVTDVIGYSPSEMIGRPLLDFVHSDHMPSAVEGFRRSVSGDHEPIELRLVSKSGEVRWVRSFGRPILEGERVVGLRGVLTDITERREMEEALQAAREELEARVERQMLRRNPYGLTFRELTILHLVAGGKSDREIGVELGISRLTAQKHISNILAKMEVTSRTEASVRAVREGLVD